MAPHNVMIKVVEYTYDGLIHKMYEMNIYLCFQIIRFINNIFLKVLITNIYIY